MPYSVLTSKDLSASDKVVYAAIASFAGDDGQAWPGVRKIASCADVSKNTAQKSINRLAEFGFLSVERGTCAKRQSNRYAIKTRPSNEDVPNPGTSQQLALGRTKNRDGDVPNSGTELEPLNQNQRTRVSGGVIELIYSAYPRKVGKAKAIQAIQRSLKIIDARDGVQDPANWLLERVTAFANSPAGQAGKFTPHPTTWFNQGRYDDDEHEWNRNGSTTDHQASRVTAAAGKYAGMSKPGVHAAGG